MTTEANQTPILRAKAAMQRAAEATIAGAPDAVALATEALALLAAAEQSQEAAPRGNVIAIRRRQGFSAGSWQG